MFYFKIYFNVYIGRTLPEYKNIGVSAMQFIARTRPCKNFIA